VLLRVGTWSVSLAVIQARLTNISCEALTPITGVAPKVTVTVSSDGTLSNIQVSMSLGGVSVVGLVAKLDSGREEDLVPSPA
jgi:hypothetical protein